MRIGMLAVDGCFSFSVAAIVDIVTTAETVRESIDPSVPSLSIELVAPRRRVVAGNGMTLAATRSLRDVGDFDVVIVPALGTITPEATEAALVGRDGAAVVRALSTLDVAKTRVAAACTGVFPLAETGLLDGRRATTTWFLSPVFRARYPRVDLDLERMVISDGPLLTAGAAFAHVDLALSIVRSVSAELAGHVARLLLIDERPSQSSFVAYDLLQHDDPVVTAFERHVRATLDQPFEVTASAAAIGVSRRTLERRTRDVLGQTPLSVVQRLRLEQARHLRRTTGLTTDAIARRVGYQNAETLRALQRRHS